MLAVSAPGKVILFGEHAVVYGVPAIAASVSLHTYIFVLDSSNEDVIELDFPDVQLAQRWNRNNLPWDKVETPAKLHQSLNMELFDALKELLSPITDPFENAASISFLYMYMHICNEKTPGKHFITRSTLPIGAGLGSSASYSVSLAGALLRLAGHIEKPLGEPSANKRELELINGWSYLGESCIHGNPSGIDNIVATNGGAVLFERVPESKPKVTPYEKFPPLNLLLTNTKISRQTAKLVYDVGCLKDSHNKIFLPVLNAIAEVVTHADSKIRQTGSADELGDSLRKLTEINHGLLVSLGVSHPSLETVRLTAQELSLGQTKLTGAGGGGCAITILEGTPSEERFNAFKSKLGDKFEVFETKLGGSGVGTADIEVPLNADDLKLLTTPDDFSKVGSWSYW